MKEGPGFTSLNTQKVPAGRDESLKCAGLFTRLPAEAISAQEGKGVAERSEAETQYNYKKKRSWLV